MKYLILLTTLLFQFFAQAQNNTVIAGGTATGITGSATYTVGQIVYKTETASSGTISQGNQQPFEIITLSTNDIPQIQLTASVYPNPTVQNITLSITNYDSSSLNYKLYDSLGKIISNGKITEIETQIEMSHLQTAIYFLKVTDATKELKTFKIIKNN